MLKALRERSGKTQKQVADAVGVNPTTLTKIESGARNPSVGVSDALLDELGASHMERSLALASAASPTRKVA